MCGYNFGIINNCYSTVSVTGDDSLGGLCGANNGSFTNYDGRINNCYATGSVTGGDYSYYLGGICGDNHGDGSISNCYAIGPVRAGDFSHFLGGLCGKNFFSTITNCYFYLLNGPDNSLGTALDDLQMQDAASFPGFDFAGDSNDGEDDYWTIVNGHCPKLTWQTDDGPLVPNPPDTTLSGRGYPYDPFLINNYEDFLEFRTNMSLRIGFYSLTVDIDLRSDTFTTAVIPGLFNGHFDGNGHVIRNLFIDTVGADNDGLGLFGKIYYGAVNNLGLENTNITGGNCSIHLGSLCGENYEGSIDNCYATGLVTGGDDSSKLGGLCGYNQTIGIISNCYASVSVTGGDDLGGLCGL